MPYFFMLMHLYVFIANFDYSGSFQYFGADCRGHRLQYPHCLSSNPGRGERWATQEGVEWNQWCVDAPLSGTSCSEACVLICRTRRHRPCNPGYIKLSLVGLLGLTLLRWDLDRGTVTQSGQVLANNSGRVRKKPKSELFHGRKSSRNSASSPLAR